MNSLKAIIAGIFIGILIAPDKGSKTRQKISDLFSYVEDDDKEHFYLTEEGDLED